MRDQAPDTGNANDKPLFKHADEQERVYAPQQLPDTPRSDASDEHASGVVETVVPGTLSTGIDTPIPGAQALDGTPEQQARDRRDT